jgi:hypothetical protein
MEPASFRAPLRVEFVKGQNKLEYLSLASLFHVSFILASKVGAYPNGAS